MGFSLLASRFSLLGFWLAVRTFAIQGFNAESS